MEKLDQQSIKDMNEVVLEFVKNAHKMSKEAQEAVATYIKEVYTTRGFAYGDEAIIKELLYGNNKHDR